jgi:hypothetical protein
MESLDTGQLRPTFTIPVALPRPEAVEALRAAFVRRQDLSGRWRGKGRWAELYVPSGERRIWSPYLSVRVDEESDGCSLFGRFAPTPAVWTFFMFLYGGIVFLVVFGSILGYVQWASGTRAWGMWALWIGMPVLGCLHLVSWIGKRLGRYQMVRLKAELEEVLLDLGSAVR